jgi:antitoxin component YwqK of YwqJK toxin-antitoxin module
MNRSDQLKYCTTCLNKKFNPLKGLVCGLTEEIADFDPKCNDYKPDGSPASQKLLQPVRIITYNPVTKPAVRKKFEKITIKDIIQIISIVIPVVLLLRLNNYIYSYSNSFWGDLNFIFTIVASSILLLLLREKKIINYSWQNTALYIVIFTFLIPIFNLIYLSVSSTNEFYESSDYVQISLLVWILSLVFAVFSIAISLPLSLLMEDNGRNIRLNPLISLALLIFLWIIENDIFITEGYKKWDSNSQIEWQDFRGNPNYLSEAHAAISSYFKYRFPEENADSLRVETIMLTHRSWTKASNNESERVLRHEQYHFHISEVYARIFRKELASIPKEKLTREKIEELYRQYLAKLNAKQNLYDRETNHSLNIENQKDWEYDIDSMLNVYTLYSVPLVYYSLPEKLEGNYFKSINLNAYYRIVGETPIDSALARKTTHYRLLYEDNRLVRVEYHPINTLYYSERYFNTPAISIKYENDDTEQWEFCDHNGSPFKNNDSIFSMRILRESSKLIITHFDDNGKNCEDVNGVAKTERELDYNGRIRIARFYNLSGKQIRNKEGFYIKVFKYNDKGQFTDQSFFNEYTQPEMVNGAARISYKYDQAGHISEISSYDPYGRICPYDEQIAISSYQYDLMGNIISQWHRKPNYNTYVDENGIAFSYFVYDEFSNLTEESHYGLNKNLIITDNITGKIRKKYDSKGRVIMVESFDAYENYLNDNNETCRTEIFYNECDQIVREKRYTADTTGTVIPAYNVFYTYDRNKNVNQKHFYNSLLKPVQDKSGFHKICMKHDNKGNLIQTDYYGSQTQLKPIFCKVTTIRYKYDERSNVTEKTYFNKNHQPSLNENKVAGERYKYDISNNIIEIEYLNAEMATSDCADGYAFINFVWDVKGNLISETHLDKTKKITENRSGIAINKYEYDNFNNLIFWGCCDKNNMLTGKFRNGVAYIKYFYNEDNKIMNISHYNAENNLQLTDEGYATEIIDYDFSGNIIRKSYYNEFEQLTNKKNGIAVFEYQYDINNNLIAEMYLNDKFELTEDSSGNAINNWVYDRNGNVTETYSYGKNPANIEKINRGPFSGKQMQNYRNQEYSISRNNNSQSVITYHPNGRIKSKVAYSNGKPEGIYTEWYPDGEVESTIEYHNGQRNGVTTEYFKNGNKSMEMIYINNTVVHKSEKTWYENGVLRSEYKDNLFITYDKRGNIIETHPAK